MNSARARNVVLAVTGGSGAVIAMAMAEALLELDLHIHFVCSRYGRVMWRQELLEPVDTAIAEWSARGSVTVYKPGDVAAPIASGSFPVRAVAIVPCSMASAAAIATGVGTNLIHRVADVAIKERRPLVIVPRETPLSPIHLRNLLTLTEAGATVLPPMPAFYKHPATIDDVVNEVVQHALVAMRLRNELPEPMQYGLKRPVRD